MAIVNILAQVVGFIVGIYLMFTRGFLVGLALIAILGIDHFLFSKLSNGLMVVHEKLAMNKDALADMRLQFSLTGTAQTPSAWQTIATLCGIAYFVFLAASIWYFLNYV